MVLCKQINPLTTEQKTEEARRIKLVNMERIRLLAEDLWAHWRKRQELSYTVLRKLIDSVLKLAEYVPMDEGAPLILLRKFNAAADTKSSHSESDEANGMVFISGYYDVKKLHRTILW